METAAYVFGGSDVLSRSRPAIVVDELREYLGMPPNHRRSKTAIQADETSSLFDLSRLPETDPALFLLQDEHSLQGRVASSAKRDDESKPESKPESEQVLHNRAASVYRYLLELSQTSIAMVVSNEDRTRLCEVVRVRVRVAENEREGKRVRASEYPIESACACLAERAAESAIASFFSCAQKNADMMPSDNFMIRPRTFQPML